MGSRRPPQENAENTPQGSSRKCARRATPEIALKDSKRRARKDKQTIAGDHAERTGEVKVRAARGIQ